VTSEQLKLFSRKCDKYIYFLQIGLTVKYHGGKGAVMDNPILFGRFLVREGKISEKDLIETIKVQNEINRSFAVAALEKDLITIDDFKKALAYQKQKGIRFRDALLELNVADQKKIEEIETTFNGNTVRLGELLVRRGIISKDELEESLNNFKVGGVVGPR
jgi:hypothetical protein